MEQSFAASAIRLELARARGAKLTSAQIVTRLGRDPGPLGEPTGAHCNAIRILAQMLERGEVRWEMPTPERRDIVYFIEPPKDDRHV